MAMCMSGELKEKYEQVHPFEWSLPNKHPLHQSSPAGVDAKLGTTF
jgi:hypothetical protein